MAKIPWRGKECKNEHIVFTATKPGEYVSINHLQSMESGFFAQAKEALTKTRYKNATIFVDHYSRLQFIYLMTSNLTLSATINAKQAFKQNVTMRGIRILHYHCSSRQFTNNNSNRHASKESRDSPYAGSMPTFKMK
jgi:hypothetical protein